MIWLLPPIIFEAGYNMNRKAFFDNIFPTTLFAFFGTVFSAFVVAGILFECGKVGYTHPFGGLAALTFGSLISATDPVTVLAVFQALGVKVDLFSMVCAHLKTRNPCSCCHTPSIFSLEPFLTCLFQLSCPIFPGLWRKRDERCRCNRSFAHSALF